MNALRSLTSLQRRLLSTLLTALSLVSAHASISPSLTSLQYDNFTGDIIASDAANPNPGFDRDALHARTVWNFSKSPGQAESAICEWRFILLEEATGAAQLIRTASGASGTVFTVARTVGFNLSITPQSRSETISADLVPLARLLPGTRYRLRCQFWRDSGAGMTLQSVHDEEWRRIWHFPELNPATTDDFTLAVVSSATLQRNNIIRSQPGQNAFKLDVSFTVRRYDNWLATSPQSTNTFIPVVVSLTNILTNTDLALSGNATNQSVGIPQFAQSGTLRVPAESTLNVTLDVLPSDWTTLNPIPLHACRISVRHGDDQSLELHNHLAFSRYLAGLTGNIRFGPLLTTFSALQNDFANTAVAPTEAGFRARGPVKLAPTGGTIPGTLHTFTMDMQELHMAFNGDLHLTQLGALIGVTAPDFPDRQSINNTTLQRGPITLTSNGAQSYGYTLFLPRGIGFSYESTPRRRRLISKITSPAISPLTSSLIPVSDPSVGNAGNRIRICLERVPQIFTANSLTFLLGSGRFTFTPVDITYVREKQASVLDRLNDIGPASAANPAAIRHHSNEEVHRFIELPALATAAFVESAPDGGASIRSLSLRPMREGSFFTHFPNRVPVQWNSLALPSPGQFVISSDRVSTASAIEGLSPFVIRYGRDCFEAAACDPPIPAAGPGSINCTPASNRLAFTENGGLQAAVTFGSHTLRWGSVNGVLFAQNSGPFTSGSFYMPGNHLPWRSPAGTPDAATAAIARKNRAATLHFAAFNVATPEVPGTNAYRSGNGDYAGLNLRMSNGTASATSTIAGVSTGPYGLTNASKYYTRPGGVSGKHESVPLTLTRRIYGMDVSLRNLRLAYLDNANSDSAIDGGLTVGTNAAASRASHFSLDFASLLFNCRGGLKSASLGPSPDFTLTYWGTLVRPLVLEFAQPANCADATQGFLKLGCQARLPSLGGANPWLAGTLGFRGTDGSLVAKADADAAGSGLTSRFSVPSSVTLAGPGSTTYSLTPATEAYLNRWPGPGVAPLTGFANLAGTIDVPFFENLRAHLHTSPDPNPAVVSTILIGPDDASGALTSADFDPSNTGAPPGKTIAQYRANYPLSARKNWLGLVDFTFPISWSASDRRFSSTAPLSKNLFIVTPEAHIESLTPATADISFGVDFSSGLSQLNVSSLYGELAGAGGNLLSKLSSNLGIDFPSVLYNISNLDDAFSDNLRDLVQSPVQSLTDPVAAQLYQASLTEAAARTQLGIVLGNLGASGQPLRSALASIVGPSSGPPSGAVKVVADLRAALADAKNISKAVSAISGIADVPIPDNISEALSQLDSLLATLEGDISSIAASALSGPLATSVETALPVSAEWESAVQQALAVLHEIHGPNFPAAFPGPSGEAAFKAAFANAVIDQFLGRDEAADLQQILRIHLSPLHDALRNATDSLLSAINRAAADATGALGAEIFANANGVLGGAVDNPIQTAKITGYARINGDSLSELRLDAKLLMKVPDETKFDASLLIRDLHSDTPGAACRLAGGAAADVTISAATTTTLSGSPTTLEAALKVSLDSSGVPVGLAGRFGIDGELDFQGLKITKLELGAGFGANDAYLYGKAAGKSDVADLDAAVFLGKTCDPDVLTRTDPSVGATLTRAGQASPGSDFGLPSSANPLYGIYAYGAGAISVNSLIGIPPSCFLNIKAGAGSGYGVFYRGNSLAPVMRQTFSISGEVLCICDIGATLDMTAAVVIAKLPGQSVFDALKNATLAGQASANFTIEVGIDPFSVEFDKTFTLYFILNKNQSPPLKLDYDL